LPNRLVFSAQAAWQPMSTLASAALQHETSSDFRPARLRRNPARPKP
jgi:hypothetical protein